MFKQIRRYLIVILTPRVKFVSTIRVDVINEYSSDQMFQNARCLELLVRGSLVKLSSMHTVRHDMRFSSFVCVFNY